MRRLLSFACLTALLLASAAPNAAEAQSGDTNRLYLTSAVTRALASHPSVGLARSKTDEARATVREVVAPWFPTLQLTASTMRYEKPMLVLPLHRLDLSQRPRFDETLIQAGLTLDLTLFDAARGPRIRRARQQARAVDATLDATQQALVARVINTYLNALAKREVLAAHDQRLASLESELSRVHQLQLVGRAADVDVLRVEAALSSAQADRVHLEAALTMAENDLGRLIGESPGVVRSEQLVPVVPIDSGEFTRDSVIAQALKFSPGILQAERQLDAARAGTTVARGARWPILRATGAYVDRGASEGSFEAEWNAGVVISYPIFTGGMVKSNVARADAAQRGAADQLRLARIQLGEDVDRALSAMQESRARIRSLTVATQRFAEVARIERLSLEAGSRTQSDYLRAEADLLSARAALVEARHAEITARAELTRLTGQLNSEWVAQSLENQR